MRVYQGSKLKIGDAVSYRGRWGDLAPIETEITGIGMKNGQVVYDNTLGLWGYRNQYERMEERGSKVATGDQVKRPYRSESERAVRGGEEAGKER